MFWRNNPRESSIEFKEKNRRNAYRIEAIDNDCFQLIVAGHPVKLLNLSSTGAAFEHLSEFNESLLSLIQQQQPVPGRLLVTLEQINYTLDVELTLITVEDGIYRCSLMSPSRKDQQRLCCAITEYQKQKIRLDKLQKP